MHITSMTIGWKPPISERITVQFDERVNLFVGPNASGKSAILEWIASQVANSIPHAWLVEYLDEGIDDKRGGYLAVSEDWLDAEMGSLIPEALPPIIRIGPIRELLPRLVGLENNSIRSETADEILNGDFSGARVQQAIKALSDAVWNMKPDNSSPYESLKGTEWTNYHKYPERHNLLKTGEITDECVKSICGEVVKGSSSHNYIPGPDVRRYLLGPRGAEPITVHLGMGVDTNDIRNFDNLSVNEAPS